MKNFRMHCSALLLVICMVICLTAIASAQEGLQTEYVDGYEVQYTDEYAYIVKDGLATIVGYIHSIYAAERNLDGDSFITGEESRGAVDQSERYQERWRIMTIPNTLDGYPVISIAPGAFNEAGLYDITISEGIVSLDSWAIDHCYHIEAITIPASVTYIAEDAFEGSSDAFGKFVCRVTKGSYADKYVQEHGFAYTYDMNYRVILSGDYLHTLKDGKATLCGYISEAEDLVVPDHLDGYPVTVIGSGSNFSPFSLFGIISVTLPEGIIVIADRTFDWCRDLTSVHLPESLTSIGKEAFSECEGLTSIVIPKGVTFIGDGAFIKCPNLTLTVTKGSYAEKYAQQNEIPYVSTVRR